MPPPVVEPGTEVVDPMGKPVCRVTRPLEYMEPLGLGVFADWQVDPPVHGAHIKTINWLSAGNDGILVHTPDGWRRLMKGKI